MDALQGIDRSRHYQGSNSVAVYDLTRQVRGRDAVVKIIDQKDLNRDASNNIKVEIANLQQVKQLLGWARKKNLYYIVMRKMGVPFEELGLDDDETLETQKTEAEQRYKDLYHMVHE